MDNSIFVQKFCPGTGKLEWDLQPKNYDYLQEVARAGFADMLHDEERNLKYNLALQKAISQFTNKGLESHVLDIGTGTGLLAIMAAKAQATEVVACETFQPMVHCAQKVISQNGCAEKIKLVSKHSTNISVGPAGDMDKKANILVTEVFDTELIGEGAIRTFNHAHEHLLSEDSVVIPSRATVFVQLVECPLAFSWNRFKPIKCSGQVIFAPEEDYTCPGNGAVHDIQLAQLGLADFKRLTDPVALFCFDWNSKLAIPKVEHISAKVAAIASGTVNAIFMWWALDMDTDGTIVLSCAPPWAHPDGEKLPWRDHWMQAIYYLPMDVQVTSEGACLKLDAYHDEYSFWFGLDQEPSVIPTIYPRPVCHCSAHLAVSRMRLGQMNDDRRNESFVRVLEKVVNHDTICVTLGDCCLLGLMVCQFGAKKVYAVESNAHCRRVVQKWVERNRLQDRMFVVDGDFEKPPSDCKVNLLVSEPVFASSVLPWHNMYFTQLKKDFASFLTDDVTIIPGKAHVYVMGIEMKDLWKIRAPVCSSQGVDLTHFDELIMNAVDVADAEFEPHPLWEYPSRCLSEPVKLMTLDLLTTPVMHNIQGLIDLPVSGTLNGLALWMEWQFDKDTVISGGPVAPPELSSYVQWDVHSKQAVRFMKKPILVDPSPGRPVPALCYQASFQPDSFELKLSFSMH